MTNSEAYADESSRPLLIESSATDSQDGSEHHYLKATDKKLALIACFLIILANAWLATLMGTPVLRLFEASACRDYYLEHDPSKIDRGGDIDEELCKLTPIQEEVLFLNTGISMLTSIISLLVTIPFGIIADKYGRRLVIGLNSLAELLFYCCIGIIGYAYQTFPSRTYIATGLFQFMGGGGRVVSAMILSIIADVSPPESRTKYFYYMEVADYTTQLIAPSLASQLMAFGIWIPFNIGICCAVVAILTVFILPETAPSRLNPDLVRTGVTSASEAVPSPDMLNDDRPLHPPPDKTMRMKCCAILQQFRQEIPEMPEKSIIRPLLSLLLAAMARTSILLLQQYASKELGWTIARTAYVISFRALVSWILFAVALPTLRKLLARKKSPHQADFQLARFSLLLLILGSSFISLAHDPITFFAAVLVASLGDGFNITLQAYMTVVVDASHVAQMCSWMAMAGTVGMISGRPLMMLAYHYGLNIQDMTHGLPYELAALLYTGAISLCWYDIQQISPGSSAQQQSLPNDPRTV